MESGALFDLLESPSPATTQADLISQIMVHLCVYGNCYLGKYRDAGAMSRLSPLDPERVQVEIKSGQPIYRYSPPQGVQQMLGSEDVLQIRALSLDGILGVSPVQQARSGSQPLRRVGEPRGRLLRHRLDPPVRDPEMPADSSLMRSPERAERLRAEARPHGVLVVEGDASDLRRWHPDGRPAIRAAARDLSQRGGASLPDSSAPDRSLDRGQPHLLHRRAAVPRLPVVLPPTLATEDRARGLR